MRLPIHYASLTYAAIISAGLFFALFCALMIISKYAIKAIAIPLIFSATVGYMSIQKIKRNLHFQGNSTLPVLV